jgi:acyl-coenzyme A synthetase/AMP-(fatty) acid ligase
MGDVGYLEVAAMPRVVSKVADTIRARSELADTVRAAADSSAKDFIASGETRTRFWFCGRKSHRVITPHGTLFTIPCEAIFNQHPWVYRSALVGVGERGNQRPVVFLEAWPEHRAQAQKHQDRLYNELRDLARRHAHTSEIADFVLVRSSLPVDIRHNAKIFREQLAVKAERMFRGSVRLGSAAELHP